MADETKRYLDYDGLAYLVKKLTNKIEASGGSTHTPCDGVYVAYVDYDGVKRICAVSDWDSTMGASQGVMVGDGTHEFLLAPNYDSQVVFWWNHTIAGTQVGGVITTDDEALALTDLNGRLNTAALLEDAAERVTSENGSGEIMTDLPAYHYGAVPAGEWWLPSLGELKMVSDRISDVVSALSAIGGTAIRHNGEEDFYWSSTQSGAKLWELSLGSQGTETDDKADAKSDYNCYLRPVAEWDWVED